MNKEILINNETISKKVVIKDDPKRPGLLIARFYDRDNDLLSTYWGKKHQNEINSYLK